MGPNDRPVRLSLEALQQLEWKRFEEAVACYFRGMGFRAELAGLGPDDATDVQLYRLGEERLYGIVQCKARTRDEPISTVREVFAEKTRQKVEYAAIIVTGTFTLPARGLAKEVGVELISGNEFIARVLSLSAEKQAEWMTFAFSGDYHTPTCPSCSEKLIPKILDGGRPPFWGCRHYPQCRGSILMRKEDAARFRSSSSPPPLPRPDSTFSSSPKRPIQAPLPKRLLLRLVLAMGLLIALPLIASRVARLWLQPAASVPMPSFQPIPAIARPERERASLPQQRHVTQPTPPPIPPRTSPLFVYQRPARLFHLAIEDREGASMEQRVLAEKIALAALPRFDDNAMPPHFAIETRPSPSHPRLRAIMLFDTHSRTLVENRIYLMSASVASRTVMLIDNRECFYIGQGVW